MDTIDTTSTDAVVLDTDSELVEAESFGKEVTKTLIVSTATSAGVFGGFVVIALLTPKVKAFFENRKNKNDNIVDAEVVPDVPETPAKKN